MRWFKHLTDASDDEFLQALEDRFGWEGYGRWWKLCEAVGKRIKRDSERAVASRPWPEWQRILKGKRVNLRSFLGCLEDDGRISTKETGNILEIEFPKLLKFRDEYTKKSGHESVQPPEKLPLQNTEDREQKKEESKARRGSRLPEPFVVTEEMQAWVVAEYPRVDWQRATREFEDYWRGVSGSRGCKLDWVATWRNAMGRASALKHLQRPGGGGSGPQGAFPGIGSAL